MTLGMQQRLLARAKERSDQWGLEVLGRLSGVNDLIAEEAAYHKICYNKFYRTSEHEMVSQIFIIIQF